MVIDKKEKIRDFIGRKLIRYKRLSPIYSLGMLILSNALLISISISWRGIHPYLSVILAMTVLLLILELSAYLYLDKGELYRAELENEMKYHPSTTYLITPYQRMLFRTIYIPYMKFITNPSKENKKLMEKSISNLSEWVDLGIIPFKHFPEKEQKYLLSKREDWFDETGKKKKRKKTGKKKLRIGK